MKRRVSSPNTDVNSSIENVSTDELGRKNLKSLEFIVDNVSFSSLRNAMLLKLRRLLAKWFQNNHALCLLIILAFVSSAVHYNNTLNRQLASASQIKLLQDALPCTYADLYKTYGGRNSHDHLVQKFEGTQSSFEKSCWSLSDEILRIPQSAFLFRESLVFLGHGFKGGVSKGYLPVQSTTKTQPSVCAVAIKTDLCRFAWSSLLSRDHESCLAKWAFQWRDSTFLGGEYLGALPFHALQNAKLENKQGSGMKGILPTWGVVEGYTWSRISHSKQKGRAHADSNIKGVIMPLIPNIIPFDSMNDTVLASHVPTVRVMARIFLSAAESLTYVSSLGLAHQDIMIKNIGLILPTLLFESETNETQQYPYAMIYDNSYMAFDTTKSCTAEKRVPNACNVCYEPTFEGGMKTKHPIDVDRDWFKQALLYVLNAVPNHNQDEKENVEEGKKTFRQMLDLCKGAENVAGLLRMVADIGDLSLDLEIVFAVNQTMACTRTTKVEEVQKCVPL